MGARRQGRSGTVIPGLDDFEGDWRVTREIVHTGGPDARFAGVARFLPDGAGLSYREEGELVIAGQVPVRAERRYLWRPGVAGAIEVLFDDGRAFHRIDPATGASCDRHRCEQDVYDVAYDFGTWPEWSSCWRVTGPRKDYEMQSRYRR